MINDIAVCIRCCIIYQKQKPLPSSREEVYWTDMGDVPFAVWSIDTAGPFLMDAYGNIYLFIAVDLLSK